jgi:hypothetical protein
VVARDSKRDLALLELERVPDRVQPLPLAPASAQPGQNVHTIGNPGSSGALWIYTFGTVRQVYRKKFLTSAPGESPFEVEAYVLETQCPTNPGDSGGPIVNDQGQLVGITQGADTEARLVSFGIDIAEIKALIKEGPKVAGDRRVKECLDKAGLKYRTLASGLFEVSAAQDEEKAHLVYITSRTRKAAGLEMREVYATALQVREKPAEGLAQQLLQKNAEETLGNWQLVKAKNGQYKVIFCVPMAADASPECLRQVVLLVQNRAAELKKECETRSEP